MTFIEKAKHELKVCITISTSCECLIANWSVSPREGHWNILDHVHKANSSAIICSLGRFPDHAAILAATWWACSAVYYVCHQCARLLELALNLPHCNQQRHVY